MTFDPIKFELEKLKNIEKILKKKAEEYKQTITNEKNSLKNIFLKKIGPNTNSNNYNNIIIEIIENINTVIDNLNTIKQDNLLKNIFKKSFERYNSDSIDDIKNELLNFIDIAIDNEVSNLTQIENKISNINSQSTDILKLKEMIKILDDIPFIKYIINKDTQKFDNIFNNIINKLNKKKIPQKSFNFLFNKNFFSDIISYKLASIQFLTVVTARFKRDGKIIVAENKLNDIKSKLNTQLIDETSTNSQINDIEELLSMSGGNGTPTPDNVATNVESPQQEEKTDNIVINLNTIKELEGTKFAELFYSCIFDFIYKINDNNNIPEITTYRDLNLRNPRSVETYVNQAPQTMKNRYQLLFDEIVLFPLLSLIKDGVEVNSLVIDQLIKGQEGEYFMLINKLLNNQTLLGRIPYFIDVLNKIRNVKLINNRDNLLKLIRLIKCEI